MQYEHVKVEQKLHVHLKCRNVDLSESCQKSSSLERSDLKRHWLVLRLETRLPRTGLPLCNEKKTENSFCHWKTLKLFCHGKNELVTINRSKTYFAMEKKLKK